MDELKKYEDDLGLHSVEGSFVILYHNGEFEIFNGKFKEAIAFVKADRRYSNYGHKGATIIAYRQMYSIKVEEVEKLLV
jgi:hypothetical protein